MTEPNGMDLSNKNGIETKKISREEKLREAKIEDQITKGIAGLTSAEEKVQFLMRKLVESEKTNKKLSQTQKQCTNLAESAKKEKDLLQQEYNKAILTKTKLESLCRELQKQNKSIKDESFSKIREEEERRKETQAKFQKSLNEIQLLMNENNEKNLKLKQDNQEMTDKFKYILEQYELREQQMEKINKQLELVQQLSDAKVAKAQMEGQAQMEQFKSERNLLETELLKARKEVLELRSAEKFLKEQVDIYSEKYSEFQDSLKKSHNVFTGYGRDMEKMSKKILKLEKETSSWRQKAEKANSVAIDLAGEKHIRDQHIHKVTKQIWQLQKLCRTLQAERTVLIAALKTNNVEIPPMPEVPPPEKEPELPVELPQDKGPDKLDVMTKNCAELKQNLAALQGQLKDIDTDASKTKTKRSKKNKNNKPTSIEADTTESTVSPATVAASEQSLETSPEALAAETPVITEAPVTDMATEVTPE